MNKVAGPYSLQWEPKAEREFDDLRPFDARPILKAIRELRYQAEDETRNRRRLRRSIDSVPEASWELRVGDHRVLYAVQKRRIVRVLRVIFKGRLQMDDAAGGSHRA
jgi:Cytotoxic translational repressor of toxin-antitoxin stability system